MIVNTVVRIKKSRNSVYAPQSVEHGQKYLAGFCQEGLEKILIRGLLFDLNLKRLAFPHTMKIASLLSDQSMAMVESDKKVDLWYCQSGL